uniref:Reverse transcriptase zinc-binding domain-containing protein n=1 Tax=Cajanus cajan TaxID=3821 RepID=A0A151RD82_CAJCA|nr:hypothetical protein KK1_038175 [Cajanus cajan]
MTLLHIKNTSQPCSWAKVVWSRFFHPMRSSILWRLLHQKMPTDENMSARGVMIVSMCSICKVVVESSDHLFL